MYESYIRARGIGVPHRPYNIRRMKIEKPSRFGEKMHNLVALFICTIIGLVMIPTWLFMGWLVVQGIKLFGRALAFMGEKITERMWKVEDEGADDSGR